MPPICSGCKKIRDDEDPWTQVEHDLAQHTQASFTHDMCPECAKAHFSKSGEQRVDVPPPA